MKTKCYAILALLAASWSPAQADTVADLLAGYRSQGAAEFDAARGAQQWQQKNGGEARSCATCHTADLRAPGKHATTGKPIEAMAPAVNPQRLQDPAKVEKWFLRNCKWTFGRECTAQEKGDFLSFIRK